MYHLETTGLYALRCSGLGMVLVMLNEIMDRLASDESFVTY
jgi:hypothetical protein